MPCLPRRLAWCVGQRHVLYSFQDAATSTVGPFKSLVYLGHLSAVAERFSSTHDAIFAWTWTDMQKQFKSSIVTFFWSFYPTTLAWWPSLLWNDSYHPGAGAPALAGTDSQNSRGGELFERNVANQATDTEVKDCLGLIESTEEQTRCSPFMPCTALVASILTAMTCMACGTEARERIRRQSFNEMGIQ